MKALPYKAFRDLKALNTKNALFVTQNTPKKTVGKITASVTNATPVPSVSAAETGMILRLFGRHTPQASKPHSNSPNNTDAAVKPSCGSLKKPSFKTIMPHLQPPMSSWIPPILAAISALWCSTTASVKSPCM